MKSLIWGIVIGGIVAGVAAYLQSRRTTFEKTAAGHKIAVPPRVRKIVPEAFREAFLEVESMELLSLDPFPEDRDPEYWRAHAMNDLPRLGEYAVLGSILLDGPELANALEQLYRGIGAGKGAPTGSVFRPRHALRIQSLRKPVILEVLLCYEAGLIRWRRNKHAYDSSTTGTAPRAFFDAMLTEAGVRLSDR